MFSSFVKLSSISCLLCLMALGCGSVEAPRATQLAHELFLLGTETEYNLHLLNVPASINPDSDYAIYDLTTLEVDVEDAQIANATLANLDTDAPVLRVRATMVGSTRVSVLSDGVEAGFVDVEVVDVDRIRIPTATFLSDYESGRLGLAADAVEADGVALMAGSHVELLPTKLAVEGVDSAGEIVPFESADWIGEDLDYSFCGAETLAQDMQNQKFLGDATFPTFPLCVIADRDGVQQVSKSFAARHSLVTNLRAVSRVDVVRVEVFVEQPATDGECDGSIVAVGYDADDRVVLGIDPAFTLGGDALPLFTEDRIYQHALQTWRRNFRAVGEQENVVSIDFDGLTAEARVFGVPCE